MTWIRPNYDPFLSLGNASIDGIAMYQKINERITMAMSEEDAGILSQVVVNGGSGNHLEIGSLYGATAILAANMKRLHNLGGNIYCIDDLEMAGPGVLRENIKGFSEIHLHAGKSNPFPFDGDLRFSTALIDAAHDYENAVADWNNVKDRVDRFIVFHDYDPSHPGVVEAVRRAAQDWTLIHASNHSAVLERR